MLHTCGKVCINMGVAITLTSVTTCHTFKIEVHHRFPLALWVALCLAIASDSFSYNTEVLRVPHDRTRRQIIEYCFISKAYRHNGGQAHKFDYKDTKIEREKRTYLPQFIWNFGANIPDNV